MKPVSGKIDRTALPDLSTITSDVVYEVDRTTPQVALNEAAVDYLHSVEADHEEILEICREVFDAPIGWDDGFSEAGGHSIVIARLAQKLQAAGWTVSVRGLLSDINTARKIAMLPRHQPLKVATIATSAHSEIRSVRDEGAAVVMSVNKFTTLQVLFAALIYSPGIAGISRSAFPC